MSVPEVSQVLWIYIVVVNIVAFAMYAWDKLSAKKKGRRIPEATLLAVAAIGGSIGALVAMVSCNHKVRKLKFNLGVPILLVLQVALYLILGMGL